jgi:hypothetical protein
MGRPRNSGKVEASEVLATKIGISKKAVKRMNNLGI